MIVNRINLIHDEVVRDRVPARPRDVPRFFGKPWLACLSIVVAVAVAGCTQAGVPSPTPPIAIASTAASPSPVAAAVSPSATANDGETATAQSVANATTTAVAQATGVAQAVDATVTVQVQVLATAASRSVQETATAAAPAASATPAAPTAAATAVPTSTTPVVAAPTSAGVTGCAIQPVRGFGLLLTTNVTVATRLGCPLNSEIGSPSITQTFESGSMLWMAKQIFVFHTAGATWSVYVDNYQNGQPLPTPTVVAPSGRTMPVGSFGFLWEQQPGVRSQVGWATGPEQSYTTGAEEQFMHGNMLWTPNQVIYVLYSDNTWQSFPDTFQA